MKPGNLRRPHSSGRLTLLALLALGIADTASRGDVIILRDGFALHGKVGSERASIIDPLTGEAISVKKASGFTSIDDGPRWTVFSEHYKRVGDVSTHNKFEDMVVFERRAKFGQYNVSNNMVLKKETDFDARWRRTLFYRDALEPIKRYDIEQQIDIMTPHYVRVISTSHTWTNYYLTRELGADKVRKLLSTHPELAEEPGKPDVGKRARLIRFLMQADWLDEAEEEVERLANDQPNDTKRADELREEVRTARLEKKLADIEQARDGGRHGYALAALKSLPKDRLPAKLSLKVAGFRAEYDAAVAKVEKARRLLTDLRGLVPSENFADLVQAADFILEELHVDAIPRLDIFIVLAEQAENARKLGKAPQNSPEQLLSAAVCGWLMGNNSTETSVATARKRLKARSVALEYLRNSSSLKRREIYLDYERDPNILPFDELEKLISLLPPPDADKNIPTGPVTRKTSPLPGSGNSVSFLLQLPPEYRHTRTYPLLIVLPDGGERTDEVLKRLGDLPGKHGYIVAALDWNNSGMINGYTGSEDEHAMVMGLLRHLRRTLQVDSDRVFLFGHGASGTYAFDVAAFHPGDFAGVIPMCPAPNINVFGYHELWRNFQNLPVYMIVGDRMGDAVKPIRTILQSWTASGTPAICSIYKGRGMEFFAAEFPYVFDWMNRKQRYSGLPDVGKRTNEYRTVRASSNRFFWISTSEIDPRFVMTSAQPRVNIPARVHAHVVEGNKIVVETVGFRNVSIWLGRESIDFARPVQVTIENRATGQWRKQITPSVAVLLEDLYERGDRQRPFYQRIDCNDLLRTIKFSAQ